MYNILYKIEKKKIQNSGFMALFKFMFGEYIWLGQLVTQLVRSFSSKFTWSKRGGHEPRLFNPGPPY